MKKYLGLFLLFVFSVNNTLGSPLIFKVKKETISEAFTELGSIDTSRYSQVRIGIIASKKFNDAAELTIYGVEDKEYIKLFTVRDASINTTVVIDSPPSKISFQAWQSGDFTIYVWGQQQQ